MPHNGRAVVRTRMHRKGREVGAREKAAGKAAAPRAACEPDSGGLAGGTIAGAARSVKEEADSLEHDAATSGLTHRRGRGHHPVRPANEFMLDTCSAGGPGLFALNSGRKEAKAKQPKNAAQIPLALHDTGHASTLASTLLGPRLFDPSIHDTSTLEQTSM